MGSGGREKGMKIIITHSKEDYNRNHIACADIVEQAVEWASHVTLFDDAHRVDYIYNMEVNSLISRPHIFMDISTTYEAAFDALQKHESQTGKADDFYLKLYDARTLLRGVQSACDRAESFIIINPNVA